MNLSCTPDDDHTRCLKNIGAMPLAMVVPSVELAYPHACSKFLPRADQFDLCCTTRYAINTEIPVTYPEALLDKTFRLSIAVILWKIT